MENNNNYGFKFDPNAPKEKEFTDNNGKSKLTIEGNGPYVNMPNRINLVNRPKTLKKVRSMNTNIGPGSNGFAGIASLAGIIAIAGAIIAFIALKY